MFPSLSKDIQRYLGEGRVTWRDRIELIFTQGVWAIVVYRFGRWVHVHLKIPVVRQLCKILAFFTQKIIEITTGICIPFSAEIGEGFYVGHFGGIILNGGVKMGKNCSLGTGVVIGTRGLGGQGVPLIGDNVYIGVGAKILGEVKIGNNVRIGANAVVLSDVPDNATAVGIPARIIIKEGEHF
ncbi:MAG: serine acetyltransferase [Candidatus Omnitrophica bacterium]|nr:serine acetyltransferase [Candidatus Omnitrophota bacterium]